MAMLFTNSSTIEFGNLLKILYESGLMSLWVETEDCFESIIKKNPGYAWGKQTEFAMNVDAGGGFMGGMSMNQGQFTSGHRVTNTTGAFTPKFQSLTHQWDRFTQQITATQAQAYIENKRQELEQKLAFQKEFMKLQMLGDGTGRQGTPIAFRNGESGSDIVSGATFTITDNWTPLGIKLSSVFGAGGSPSYFLEGSVVSFVYADLDTNDDGTNDVAAAAGHMRLLTLQCVDSVSAGNYKWDAFKVVRIDQENDMIYVFPARAHAGVTQTVSETYIANDPKNAQWVPGGSGSLTVTPLRGYRLEGVTDANYAASVNDLALIFGAATYPSLIHPKYLCPTEAEARVQLGIGWTSATDLGRISSYVLTGLEAHLFNRSNTVHGIARGALPQLLPTYNNLNGQELTFNMLFRFLASHVNRNRGALPPNSALLINPIGYSSMITQGELGGKVFTGESMRGNSTAHMIKFGDKTFEFDASSCMRKDYVVSIAKDTLELKGGELDPVEVGGQREFLSLSSGKRINQAEAYQTITAEMTMNTDSPALRQCAFMGNFKVTG